MAIFLAIFNYVGSASKNKNLYVGYQVQVLSGIRIIFCIFVVGEKIV